MDNPQHRRPAMSEDRELMKQATKEAIKEWLSEQLASFGWWSMKVIGGLALAALCYFILRMNGWQSP